MRKSLKLTGLAMRRASSFSGSIGNKIGGRYTVTLIPGDGIGKEISESVKTIFKSQKVPVDFEQIDVTGQVKPDGENDLFKQSIESLKRNKIGLKGRDFQRDCFDAFFSPKN